MTRRVWIISLLSIFGLLGAAGASANHEERVEQFRIQAEKDRVRLKLDRDAAKGRYPTPELTLRTTNGEPLRLRAGQTAELKASGTLVDGSLVVLPCDGVQVVSLQQAKDGVTAKVKVAANQLPTACDLRAISPVSFVSAYVPALEVVGSYAWDLKIANGMTAKWTTATGEDGFAGTAEFFAGGKSLGKRPLTLRGQANRWSAEVAHSDEEQTQMSAQFQKNASQSKVDDSMAKMQALTEKMQAECAKVAPEKMGACYGKYQAQLEAVSAPLKEAGEANEALTKIHPAACLTLDLEVTDGKVTGTAHGCRAEGEHEVTGKVVARN